MSRLHLATECKENPRKYDLVGADGDNMMFKFTHCGVAGCIGNITYSIKYEPKIHAERFGVPEHVHPETVRVLDCHVMRSKNHPWTYLYTDNYLFKRHLKLVRGEVNKLNKDYRSRKSFVQKINIDAWSTYYLFLPHNWGGITMIMTICKLLGTIILCFNPRQASSLYRRLSS